MVEIPDTPMFQAQFSDDSGNLYKPSGTGAQFGSFIQAHFPIKTNEEKANWNDIQDLFTALHADRSDAAQWRSGLEKVFDVEGFLHYLAINNVIQNWDTYGSMAHNYYLYNDPGDGLIHWVPWDHNMSLGGAPGPGGQASNTTAPPEPRENGRGRRVVSLGMEEVTDQWPLIRFLADDPVYLKKYQAYVKETSENAFAQEKTEAYFRQQHNLIRPYVVGAEGEQEDATLLQSSDAFDTSIDSLTEHIKQRHQAVSEYLSQTEFN